MAHAAVAMLPASSTNIVESPQNESYRTRSDPIGAEPASCIDHPGLRHRIDLLTRRLPKAQGQGHTDSS
jgi:hypothetical protein